MAMHAGTPLSLRACIRHDSPHHAKLNLRLKSSRARSFYKYFYTPVNHYTLIQTDRSWQFSLLCFPRPTGNRAERQVRQWKRNTQEFALAK